MLYYITVCKFSDSKMYCKYHCEPLHAWFMYSSAKWLPLYNAFQEGFYQNIHPFCVPFHHVILPVIFIKHTYEKFNLREFYFWQKFCINNRFWQRVWKGIQLKLSDSRLPLLNAVVPSMWLNLKHQIYYIVVFPCQYLFLIGTRITQNVLIN
jgi:hypothetical protein